MSKKNKVFRTFDQFERAWKAENIPTPELQHSYAQILRTAGGKKTNLSWLRPLPIAVAILGIGVLLLAGTQVSALVSKYILYDRDGEAVLVYDETSVEQSKIDEQIRAIYMPFFDTMEQIKRGLGAEETAIFLVPEAYKLNGSYYTLQQDNNFTDINTLSQAADTDFSLPAYIPSGYQFTEGTISYSINEMDRDLLKQWAVEASEAGLPYIVKNLPQTLKTERISYQYSKLEYPSYFSLRVSIDEATGYTSVDSLEHEETEVVDLGHGVEAIYEKALRSLTFVLTTDGNNYQYRVESSDATPEGELLKFAKSLIPTLD
ncbi:hypothetical protein A7K91_25790 [Paenibacillus oryzae]|uniref:DUF4367 domain-containing protein n=1 Tax=Paenibacillus oryzae TaxID=1844972 RepID=A0A1A5YTK7_9BACL|nr:hypothetical protein [Paenibacillus oryzae]OBR68898.1 hypothetical protein A7K91_25790 [Paenibacillus oryzae]